MSPASRASAGLSCGLRAAGTLAGAQGRATRPGDPLPGITPAEFEEFRLGLDDFLEVETAEEGLGPAFNGTSCAVCHSVPAVGGTSAIAEVRAGRLLPDGRFEGLDASGETLIHLFSLPGHGCQPVIPADAIRRESVVRRLCGRSLLEHVFGDPAELLLGQQFLRSERVVLDCRCHLQGFVFARLDAELLEPGADGIDPAALAHHDLGGRLTDEFRAHRK